MHLSGNPESGESPLARLTAKQLFDEGKETPPSIPFLRTLNAENSETLLESPASFARHCRRPNYIVTDTHNSKDLSTDEKIASLTTLSNKRNIGLHTSWLLLGDNVTSLSHVHTYLPDPGNQQWVRGQLPTTQDLKSIPLTSSSIQHISLSEGILPNHASSFLRLLSGVTNDETGKEIARSLDY